MLRSFQSFNTYRKFNSSCEQKYPTMKENLQKRDKLWCEHYYKKSHTKDTCKKIHGKLANWKLAHKKHDSLGNITSAKNKDLVESKPFNKEQITVLQKMVEQIMESFISLATTFVAQISENMTTLKHQKNEIWSLGYEFRS